MSFTRDTALYALVLALVGCGVYLIVRSIWLLQGPNESRRHRATLLLIGIAILAMVIALRPSVLVDTITGSVQDANGIFAVAVVVASLVAGAAMGDYVFARLVPAIGYLFGRETERRGTVEFFTALVGGLALLALGWAALGIVDPAVETEAGGSTAFSVEVLAEFALPDEPRDLVFTGPASGYISFPGQIAYFEVRGSGENRELTLEEAVGSDGIDNPRGMTAMEGYLFVSEQGEPEEDAPEGLMSTNGQVLRFNAASEGQLSERTVVLEDVPIADNLHGINGLAAGPDSMIYLSVGGTRAQPEPEPSNIEWLGSILRFDRDGNNVGVYASGLRNVYDIEFDDQGRLWGVDNDGPTYRDYRAEEVLQIKEGSHYGYPEEGTYGTSSTRTDVPVWAYTGHDVEGTAGIELAQNVGVGTGVLIGARTLTYIEVSEDEEGLYVGIDYDFEGAEEIFRRQGYFTIVESDSAGLLYVGVNGLSLQSNLYLLEVTE